MGCLLAILALFSPRLVLFIIWLFTDYLSRAYDSFIIPFVGFLIVPMTTLAWAWIVNSGTGLSGLGIVVLIVALLMDLGLIGAGGRGARG